MRRRSATACKSATGLTQPLVLFQTDHNVVLSHASLRLPLAEPIATTGRGSAKLGQSRTPAMAAGLTDQVWTLKDVRRFRVPPWPQPQTVEASGRADDGGCLGDVCSTAGQKASMTD
jgi:hypothetical protein